MYLHGLRQSMFLDARLKESKVDISGWTEPIPEQKPLEGTFKFSLQTQGLNFSREIVGTFLAPLIVGLFRTDGSLVLFLLLSLLFSY